MPHCFRLLLLSVLVGASFETASAQQTSRYRNLQVLPADVSREALIEAMLDNLRGLGLPRRQSEGCLYCHVGDMERPSDTWDWASDAKPAKLKARSMMRMVDAINREHLSKLEDRLDPPLTVSCFTCHTGRPDPRSLQDILRSVYRSDGIDGAIATYEQLRERHAGGIAYDFRAGVLAEVAFELATDEALDDAVSLAALNVGLEPPLAGAREAWLQLRLARTTREKGVEDALAEFDEMSQSETVDEAILDKLGWWLYRQEHQADAIATFRHNVNRYPDAYIPHESLADALWFLGEQTRAIQLFEAWLEKNPDHTMARRRLATLRSQL